MSCIHTGADIYLNEYGSVIRADLYLIGGAVVARASVPRHGRGYDRSKMYAIRSVGAGWFDKRSETTSTIVVPRAQLELPDNEDTRSRWS